MSLLLLQLDEVHERSVENDLLALVVKLLVSRQPDNWITRVIVMSATIQGRLFDQYFASLNIAAPIPHIYVGAKRFNVNVTFLEDFGRRLPTLDESSHKSLKKLVKKFDETSVTKRHDNCNVLSRCYSMPYPSSKGIERLA